MLLGEKCKDNCVYQGNDDMVQGNNYTTIEYLQVLDIPSSEIFPTSLVWRSHPDGLTFKKSWSLFAIEPFCAQTMRSPMYQIKCLLSTREYIFCSWVEGRGR